MGTRGLFGFYYKGKYYVVYNQFDSYPSGLGVDIVEQIKCAMETGVFLQWPTKLENIKVINPDSPHPTAEDIKNLTIYTDLRVSDQSTLDWYCLVLNCQVYLFNA